MIKRLLRALRHATKDATVATNEGSHMVKKDTTYQYKKTEDMFEIANNIGDLYEQMASEVEMINKTVTEYKIDLPDSYNSTYLIEMIKQVEAAIADAIKEERLQEEKLIQFIKELGPKPGFEQFFMQGKFINGKIKARSNKLKKLTFDLNYLQNELINKIHEEKIKEFSEKNGIKVLSVDWTKDGHTTIEVE